MVRLEHTFASGSSSWVFSGPEFEWEVRGSEDKRFEAYGIFGSEDSRQRQRPGVA